MPVLMYHKLGTAPSGSTVPGHYVAQRRFASQLKLLRALRFTPVSLAEYEDAFRASRPISITFDDGYANNFHLGLPLLQRFGMTATVFVVTERVGGVNAWDDGLERLMSKEQLEAWLSAGQFVGSHSATHARLPDLSHDELRRELIESKRWISESLGLTRMPFCYPYGANSRQVRHEVESLGYSVACSTRKGANSVNTDKYDLARINVRRDTFSLALLVKLLRSYRNVR